MFHIKIICICILHLWCWQIWLHWFLVSIQWLLRFWLEYFRVHSHWKAFGHQLSLLNSWDLWLIWGQKDHTLKHSLSRGLSALLGFVHLVCCAPVVGLTHGPTNRHVCCQDVNRSSSWSQVSKLHSRSRWQWWLWLSSAKAFHITTNTRKAVRSFVSGYYETRLYLLSGVTNRCLLVQEWLLWASYVWRAHISQADCLHSFPCVAGILLPLFPLALCSHA